MNPEKYFLPEKWRLKNSNIFTFFKDNLGSVLEIVLGTKIEKILFLLFSDNLFNSKLDPYDKNRHAVDNLATNKDSEKYAALQIEFVA